MPETCDFCGAVIEPQDPHAPTKFEAHPGCFALFNTVIAREFSDAAYFSVHRLTVDCWATQHPGRTPKRAWVQSHNIHLMAIYMDIIVKAPNQTVTHALKRAATKGKGTFKPLSPPPPDAYSMTVADVVKAGDAATHRKAVRDWAQDIWQAWDAHHDTAIALAEKYGQLDG